MINGDQRAVRPADFSAGILEAFKGLLWWWSVRFVVGIRASWRLRLTGEVTSWTRCLSVAGLASHSSHSLDQRRRLNIPIYSRMVPSSCSLTMWASSTLSYRVLGFLSAAGMMGNGIRGRDRRTAQQASTSRAKGIGSEDREDVVIVKKMKMQSKCPFLFFYRFQLEGSLRFRLVSRLWAAADWLPRQIGWISLPKPVPLSCLGGAFYIHYRVQYRHYRHYRIQHRGSISI